jgi:hypothetical protein
MRIILLTLLVVAMAGSAALAQIPAGPGQLPGTLPPAPPIAPPPPLTAPPPVPSAVTPLPSPSYGVPAGATRRPSYGSYTTTGTYRAKPKPRHKKKRRPRTSEILFIRTV